MKKIIVKYLENGFQYKSSRSKNSQVVIKSTFPVDLNKPSTTEDSVFKNLKTSKYSVSFNKLNGKTEISQYLNMLTKQSAKKSRLVKELVMTIDEINSLEKDFSQIENYLA